MLLLHTTYMAIYIHMKMLFSGHLKDGVCLVIKIGKV